MKKLYTAVVLLLACLFSSITFAQITGPTSYCTGHNDTLHGLPAGGSWSSSNTAVATISATGIITPIGVGTASISYSSWPTAVVITVNPSPAPIVGASGVPCGGTTTLTDVTPGGTWSSSNTAVATVSASGVVSPVSYSSVLISYTLPSGCSAIQSVNVAGTTPYAAISGPSVVCAGGTISLSTTVPGSTAWSTGAGMASVSSTGVVTGITAGYDAVICSLTTACGTIPLYHSVVVTATATAGSISGAPTVACGSTSTLTSTAGAGSWVSSSPGIATVGATTGIVTPVTTGSATISFTYTSSCGTASTTAPLTVSLPSAGTISGFSVTYCGGTTTLTSTAAGGTWSSSAPGVATINSSTGIVNGVSAGTTIITYTIGPPSCGTSATTAALTVIPGFAGTITGPSAICPGTPTTYTSTITGGTWSSGSSILSVTSGGTITGTGAGTATITYTAVGACGPIPTTAVITVLAPGTTGPVSGSTSLICGSSGTLSCAPAGGTWSSSTPGVATINPSTGIVTSVSAGTTTISYTTLPGTCGTVTTTAVLTVAPGSAGTIAGPSTVCVGGLASWSSTITGGTWSSSAPGVATINPLTGIVTGVSAGTTSITYTMSSAGCGTTTTTAVLSVVTGSAGTISGLSTVCIGGTVSLSSTVTGGTWSSSSPVLVVTPGGVVTGAGTGTGTGTITYTTTSVCGTTTTTTPITVYPSSAGTISGASTTYCGGTTTLTSTAPGGTWSSSAPGVATISLSTGVASGVSAGTTTISYTMTSSCGISVTTMVLTVIPGFAGTITGPSTICPGTPTTYTSTIPGGTWSSGSSVLTVTSGGTVTGTGVGTATITYTAVGACGPIPTTAVITVLAPGTTGPVSGSTSLLCGGSGTLSCAPAGGTWSSSTPGVATINPSTGIVTSVSAGTTTISYTTLPGTCGTVTTTAVLTVAPGSAGTIAGPSTVCVSGLASWSSTITGGTWSSSAPGVATINPSTGIVTGVPAGTTSITYTMSSAGCGTTTTTAVLSVVIGSAGTISGPSTVCTGGTVSLSSTVTGGTWSSSSPVLVVTPGGVVTGTGTGTGTITYTTTSVCGTTTTTTPLTVYPSSAGTISGASITYCGGTTTLTSTAAGGTWNSSAPGVATISLSTGVASGVSAGTTTISYTMTSSCGISVTTMVLTVIPGFAGTITGPSTICPGTPTTYTSTIPGGTWSSGSSVLTVTSGGTVTGTGVGTATITYTAVGACGPVPTTEVITVMPAAATGAITGTTSLVCGSSGSYWGILTSTVPGGTWSSSNPAVATIAAGGGVGGGIVTSVSAGTSTISYTVSTPCDTAVTTVVVHVSTQPITVFVTPISCNANAYGLALDASTYVWAPASGLSCTACATPVVNPTVTTVYTVTGTSSCGTATTTVLVTANRIHGHISFSGTPAPAPGTSKVWLIQFNPADSTIVARDSMLTCYDTATSSEYYQFDGKPAGNYLVKAQWLSSGGPTGYIPTYGSSTPYWFSAAPISHAAGTTNVQDINMIYGTVPAGPGFINGYVYAGAGKGTSTGVPGMLVYLKSATTGDVLAFTYTDAGGFYWFSSLAFGDYIIYPEDFGYYTTSSSVITLSSAISSITNVIFRQFDDPRIIIPSAPTSVAAVSGNNAIMIHPNPTSGTVHIGWQNQTIGNGIISVTDMVGREVYRSALHINTASGEQAISLDKLSAGAYIINVRSERINYTGKLLLNK